MKVSLNLAIAPSRRQRYALAWAAPLTVLALAGLAFLCVSTVRGAREYRRIHLDRLKLEAREAALNKAEVDLRKDLEQPQFRKLFREIQFVNALIEKKQISLTTLAGRVNKLLPVSVRLAGLSLTQSGQDRVVRFVVVGGSEEAVENFLINLEDSSDFKDPVIINPNIEEVGDAPGQVMITCTARYLGGERR